MLVNRQTFAWAVVFLKAYEAITTLADRAGNVQARRRDGINRVGKGITNTVMSWAQAEAISGDLPRLVTGWPILPDDLKQPIVRLLQQN